MNNDDWLVEQNEYKKRMSCNLLRIKIYALQLRVLTVVTYIIMNKHPL